MKMQEAVDIMKLVPLSKCKKGFMVTFSRVVGCSGAGLLSDHFPDDFNGETLIETEGEAWTLAERFASCTVGKCVDIYVCDACGIPVPGYRLRKIDNREPSIVSRESKLDRAKLLVETINSSLRELQAIKGKYPELKSGYQDNPGSILNAYREGDISFEDARSRLERHAPTLDPTAPGGANKIDAISTYHVPADVMEKLQPGVLYTVQLESDVNGSPGEGRE